MRLIPILFALCFLVGCFDSSTPLKSSKTYKHKNTQITEQADLDSVRIDSLTDKAPIAINYSEEALGQAINRAANTLLNRFATIKEIKSASKGIQNYSDIIDKFLDDPKLVKTMREYNNGFFGMAGVMTENNVQDGINYNEPTNLVLHLMKTNGDYRHVVRANYCVSNSLTPTSCSAFKNTAESNAQASGILTTQAFLSTYANHYNFSRVNAMKRFFTCSSFPDQSDPGMAENEISEKVKQFNCTDCDPQCISCHRVINSRASLFYHFNWKGKYVLQTYNSTTNDSDKPSDIDDLLVPGTKPRYYDREVQKIQDMGRILAGRDEFRNCMVQRFTNFLLGRKSELLLPEGMRDLYLSKAAKSFKIKAVLKSALTHPMYIVK